MVDDLLDDSWFLCLDLVQTVIELSLLPGHFPEACFQFFLSLSDLAVRFTLASSEFLERRSDLLDQRLVHVLHRVNDQRVLLLLLKHLNALLV